MAYAVSKTLSIATYGRVVTRCASTAYHVDYVQFKPVCKQGGQDTNAIVARNISGPREVTQRSTELTAASPISACRSRMLAGRVTPNFFCTPAASTRSRPFGFITCMYVMSQ
jgi:hypothetical protein